MNAAHVTVLRTKVPRDVDPVPLPGTCRRATGKVSGNTVVAPDRSNRTGELARIVGINEKGRVANELR